MKAACGHELIALYEDSDNNQHVIGKESNGRYIVGFFYDPTARSWGHGHYDFLTMESAIDHLRLRFIDRFLKLKELF